MHSCLPSLEQVIRVNDPSYPCEPPLLGWGQGVSEPKASCGGRPARVTLSSPFPGIIRVASESHPVTTVNARGHALVALPGPGPAGPARDHAVVRAHGAGVCLCFFLCVCVCVSMCKGKCAWVPVCVCARVRVRVPVPLRVLACFSACLCVCLCMCACENLEKESAVSLVKRGRDGDRGIEGLKA